jgi:hypothetical protein
MALGLSVTVPDQPSATIARIYLGSCLMCTVTEHRGEWQYLISGHLVINGDQTLLQAQLSALVHEAIAAKANHNPSDYAGIIPTGV